MRPKFRAWTSVALTVLMTACANPAKKILQADPGTGLYERSRNPEQSDRAAIRFRAAYDHRDPAALRQEFAEALALCESDGFNASESVAVAWLLQLYLARFGDERFASALASETLRTQSAVGYHLVSGANWNAADHADFAKIHPQTDRILRAAPEINWPVDKAIATIMAN